MTAPLPDDEILAQLRDYLAQALEEFALKNVVEAHAFTLAGNAEAATAATLQALLAGFLSNDVRGWTHTTRLREHLAKFSAGVARERLEGLAREHGIEIKIQAVQ